MSPRVFFHFSSAPVLCIHYASLVLLSLAMLTLPTVLPVTAFSLPFLYDCPTQMTSRNDTYRTSSNRPFWSTGTQQYRLLPHAQWCGWNSIPCTAHSSRCTRTRAPGSSKRAPKIKPSASVDPTSDDHLRSTNSKACRCTKREQRGHIPRGASGNCINSSGNLELRLSTIFLAHKFLDNAGIWQMMIVQVRRTLNGGHIIRQAWSIVWA